MPADEEAYLHLVRLRSEMQNGNAQGRIVIHLCCIVFIFLNIHL